MLDRGERDRVGLRLTFCSRAVVQHNCQRVAGPSPAVARGLLESVEGVLWRVRSVPAGLPVLESQREE